MNTPRIEGYTPRDAEGPVPRKPKDFIPVGNIKIRTNVGFIIIASRRNRAGEEIVLGYNPESKLYVTWLCLGGYDYNNGHYGPDFFKAVEDFRRRSQR